MTAEAKRRFTASSVRPLLEPMAMWAKHQISTGRLVEIFREWDGGAETFALPLSNAERVKRCVRSSSGMTAAEVSVATGIDKKRLAFILTRLKSKGAIRATGKQPGYVYVAPWGER